MGNQSPKAVVPIPDWIVEILLCNGYLSIVELARVAHLSKCWKRCVYGQETQRNLKGLLDLRDLERILWRPRRPRKYHPNTVLENAFKMLLNTGRISLKGPDRIKYVCVLYQQIMTLLYLDLQVHVYGLLISTRP